MDNNGTPTDYPFVTIGELRREVEKVPTKYDGRKVVIWADGEEYRPKLTSMGMDNETRYRDEDTGNEIFIISDFL